MPDAIPVLPTFGERVRWWRKRRGIDNQGELAKRLKIAQASLSALESGASKSPSGEVLAKLCAVLGLRVQYLMFNEGPPEGLAFSELNGLEAQLVMVYRQLPEARQQALMIDANEMLRRHQAGEAPAPTPAPIPTFEPASDAERALSEARRRKEKLRRKQAKPKKPGRNER